MKKIKYQLTARSFILIEPKNKKEEEVIKNLNNEFDKFKKRNRTYIKNTISIDSTLKKGPYELSDNSMDILDKLIFNEKKYEIEHAIKRLPKREKETIIEYFYNGKSLRQIASKKKLNDKTIRESYHAAINNLKKYIKK